MRKIRRIRTGEGSLYRSLRLEALKDSPEAFQTTYEEALAKDDGLWAAQADGAATGQDRASFLAFAEAELLQVWLAPGFRGTGLSRELVMACIRWSGEVGIRRLVAELKAGNDHARRFYLGLGFSSSNNDGTILELDPREAARDRDCGQQGRAL